jgi:hypothetical protein
MLIHDAGIDFHVLTPLWLAIALFVALPALFGAAIAVAVDRAAATHVPAGWQPWILPLVLVLVFPLVVPVVALAGVVAAGGVSLRRGVDRVGRIPAGLIVVVRGAWLVIALPGFVALVADIRALA